MLTVAGVFQPVPDHGLLRISDATASNVLDTFIDLLLEEVEEIRHRHVVLIDDGLQRVALG
jgi:hypothetical protein